MTPQERQLIDSLFDKLASLEQAPRDAEASSAISAGLRRAPNAAYALVQTVLLQDEALKRANDRIQELEAGGQPQAQSGGFLDSMRDTLFGGDTGSRGSVPNVRPSDPARGPTWNSGQVLGQSNGYGQQAGYGQGQFGNGPQPPQAGGGGSFLGTAAAAAAGVVGGSLLMNSIRGLMGGSHQGFGDQTSLGHDRSGSDNASPWSGGSKGSDELARDAGINDIGKNSGGNDQRQSFTDQQSDNYDTASHDEDDDFDTDDDSDFDGGGDSDYA